VTERLVVIGADAAGMSAASQARRRRGPDELEIIAFEQGNYTSYSACGIPYYVGGVVEDLERLVVRSPETFRVKQDIEVRMRHRVTNLNLDDRTVTARILEDDGESREGFDHLLITSGAIPVRPELEGIDSRGIFGVQILDDGRAIYETLEIKRPKSAVIVGGGYIGLEMAEAFKQRDLDVTVVEMADQPLSTLDPDMGSLVAQAMRSMGIEVYTNEKVEAFEGEDGWVKAVITKERTLSAEIVVLGLGVRPNSTLAEAAGVPLGPSGAIAVDKRMRTGKDGVWSAGDCAEKFHRVSRSPVAIALGTHANKEGRVAGINLGGGSATFPGVLGTAVSKVCDTEIGRTGLNESEASAAGFEWDSVVVDSTTRAGYFPGAAPIRTKLVFERGPERLLGAQIVGREGAAKRIDVLATALWNEMTVDELVNLDLSYAPPFSPVWDPVLIAARRAASHGGGAG
jgi:NADPH-dependent 2,4-dienoyl-CoA reductase/sulfur reductase-like enzyme